MTANEITHADRAFASSIIEKVMEGETRGYEVAKLIAAHYTKQRGEVCVCPATNQPCANPPLCTTACHARMVAIMLEAEKRGWRGVHIDTYSGSPSGLIGIPPPPKSGFPVNVPTTF